MSHRTKIEWTKQTWNPTVGCSIVSPGCTNCYAMKIATRLEKMLPPERRGSAVLPNHYSALTKPSKGGSVWTGRINRAPDHILFEPLRRKKPTMWFVNSMSDLFHEDVPDAWILEVLDVIRRASYDGGSNIGKIGGGDGEHTFQVLTKRSARMCQFMQRLRWDGQKLVLSDDNHPPLVMRNLWLGVSAEDQKRADERIPDLLATPAAVRFVSAEPLLGPLDLAPWLSDDDGCESCDDGDGLAFPRCGRDDIPRAEQCPRKLAVFETIEHGPYDSDGCPSSITVDRKVLNWVIVGGESGNGARPMSIQWARETRDQCVTAGVAFFFKQWGEWAPAPVKASGTPGRFAFGDYEHDRERMVLASTYPREFTKFGARTVLERIGKKAAGRLLDGREWNEMPARAEKASAA